MDRWIFLVSVLVVSCFLYPPFLGMCIGVAFFYGIAFVVYGVLGGFTR